MNQDPSSEEADAPAQPGQLPATTSAYDRFWKHPHAIAFVVVLGLSLNVLLVVVLGLAVGADDDAEAVQTLVAGGDRYVLFFHRTQRDYNTVAKNGVRIYDSREAGLDNCVRLKLRPDGGASVECLDAERRESVTLPLP